MYFIRQSTCPHSLFENPRHEFEAATDGDSGKLAIKQLCETRWACSNKGSGGKFASNCIEDETLQAKTAADAMHQLQSFEFLLAMVVLKQLLAYIQCYQPIPTIKAD